MIITGAGALILATLARGGFQAEGDAAIIDSLAYLDVFAEFARKRRGADDA